jgi:hypothetical protein
MHVEVFLFGLELDLSSVLCLWCVCVFFFFWRVSLCVYMCYVKHPVLTALSGRLTHVVVQPSSLHLSKTFNI